VGGREGGKEGGREGRRGKRMEGGAIDKRVGGREGRRGEEEENEVHIFQGGDVSPRVRNRTIQLVIVQITRAYKNETEKALREGRT